MTAGRVVSVHKDRLGAQVSTTVVGDGSTRVIPVDSSVVDFDEDGGQLLHEPTGDIYSYSSADADAETVTLSAGLPIGKTFTGNEDTLLVYPESNDLYAQIAIDDDPTDVVTARIPQNIRDQVEEGGREFGKGDVLRAVAGDEEWQVTEKVGSETSSQQTGYFFSGDLKPTARSVAGGGVLIDDGWLKCDGSSVSRATYASLFNAIGTTYGSASATTFNLPDYRDRTMFGVGPSVTLGADEGASAGNRGPAHTHTVLSAGGHTHAINDTSHNGASNTPITGGNDRVVTIAGNSSGTHNHGGNTVSNGGHDHSGETGSGVSASNKFGYIGANILIKT